MNALAAAIQYNNIGVTLLESGHHEVGLEVFRGSAELMYTATNARNHVSSQTNTASEDEKIMQVKAKLQLTHITSLTKAKKIDSQIEIDCFLYHTGIRLTPPPSEGQPIYSCALVSATVLFNMALAYHLGSPQPHQICPSLHNALTLYDMAYNVATRVGTQPESQLVICASLNNLGQLHHELGQYSTSRKNLDNLSSYIVSLDPHAADNKSIIERRQFLLNAMMLHKPRGAPAA